MLWSGSPLAYACLLVIESCKKVNFMAVREQMLASTQSQVMSSKAPLDNAPWLKSSFATRILQLSTSFTMKAVTLV